MWFDVVGATLGFIGSVIFSAGLIKPKEQIVDEHRTYFDANPYTTNAELASQRYYIVAFILIISGFAVSIGGKLGEVLGRGDGLVSVLFAVALSLVGILATVLLLIHRTGGHQRKKTEVAKGIFANVVQNYISNMRAIEGKPNTQEVFDAYKKTYLKDLSERAELIAERGNEKELQLVKDIKLTKTPQDFVKAAERYEA